MGLDNKWIPRLQAAAHDSLEVAIEEGDVPTLISWLELIAHEPLSYQLQDILRDGVLSSVERAHKDGELGIHLILIAARRLPNIADSLYDDQALIAALPTKMSRALRDNSPAALEPLIEETAEYFSARALSRHRDIPTSKWLRSHPYNTFGRYSLPSSASIFR